MAARSGRSERPRRGLHLRTPAEAREWGAELAVVRSMSSKEGDHGRAISLLQTGYSPQGAIQFPSIGALVAKELGPESADLPNFVSIAPAEPLGPVGSLAHDTTRSSLAIRLPPRRD